MEYFISKIDFFRTKKAATVRLLSSYAIEKSFVPGNYKLSLFQFVFMWLPFILHRYDACELSEVFL